MNDALILKNKLKEIWAEKGLSQAQLALCIALNKKFEELFYFDYRSYMTERANEDKKDFSAVLDNSNDMPKFQTITEPKSIKKYGRSKMYFALPIDYDRAMKQIPYGKVITIEKVLDHDIVILKLCRGVFI